MITDYERSLLDALLQRATPGEHLEAIYFCNHQQEPGPLTAACLSQWYPSAFELDGQHYVHAEQYMMAEKARLFKDETTRQAILHTDDPGEAQQLGRKVQSFQQDTWLAERFNIVVQGNVAKFKQNPALGQFFLATGEQPLVEASPDRIWGTGFRITDQRAYQPQHWRGFNLLGLALMQARAVIRTATD